MSFCEVFCEHVVRFFSLVFIFAFSYLKTTCTPRYLQQNNNLLFKVLASTLQRLHLVAHYGLQSIACLAEGLACGRLSFNQIGLFFVLDRLCC